MEVKKIFCKRLPFIGMILFLVLFIYTATSKLLNYENFETQLGQSPVFTAYADYLAIALPIFELYRSWFIFDFKLSINCLLFEFCINGNVYYLYYNHFKL